MPPHNPGLTLPITVLAILFAALPVQAQPRDQLLPLPQGLAQPAPPPVAPPPPQQMSPVQAAVEQRIAGIQTQLAITQAQSAPWYAFAQVMRDNAQSSDALLRQRAGTARTMSASANMQSYAQIARNHADGTEKLASTFQALYDTMSPQQRQTADTMFQQQAAPPPAPNRRR